MYIKQPALLLWISVNSANGFLVQPLVQPPQPTILSKGGADTTAYDNGHDNCPNEVPPTYLPMHLPKDFPTGSYFRNGGGRYSSEDGVKVMHPFDSDGLVNAFTFDPENQRVLFRNKFVETEKYKRDRSTRTMSSRGFFGTPRSGGFLKNLLRMKPENVANTNVVLTKDGKTLYALWEAGKPYAMDPLTLKTKGEDDLDGMIDEECSFSAHPRYDPRRDSYVNFCLGQPDPLTGKTLMKLVEFDATDFKSKSKGATFKIPGIVLFHDFNLTENYCIFGWTRAKVSGEGAMKAALGLGPMSDFIEVDSDKKEFSFVVVPRSLIEEGAENIDFENDPRITTFNVPFFFGFHFGNGFEEEDGKIVVDAIQWFQDPEKADFGNSWMEESGKPLVSCIPWDEVPSARLVRYTLDMETKKLSKPPKLISTQATEFPVLSDELSTRKNRYLFSVAAHKRQKVDESTFSPAGSVIKIDMETNQTGEHEFYAFKPHEFVSEPAFVPKVGVTDFSIPKNEDRAYLVVVLSNGRDKTSELVVFDVEGQGNLSKGPISRLPLPTYIPLGATHGKFCTGVTYDLKTKR